VYDGRAITPTDSHSTLTQAVAVPGLGVFRVASKPAHGRAVLAPTGESDVPCFHFHVRVFNPTQVYVSPTQACVNSTQACVNSTQVRFQGQRCEAKQQAHAVEGASRAHAPSLAAGAWWTPHDGGPPLQQCTHSTAPRESVSVSAHTHSGPGGHLRHRHMSWGCAQCVTTGW
jgi:hypothetical protein